MPPALEPAAHGPVTVFIDGASSGNPGPSGIGAVFTDANGRTIARMQRSLGHATNNVAEYLALIYALQEALARRVDIVEVRTDSELLVRQLAGRYQVRDSTLRLLHDLAQALRDRFQRCTIEHVGREFNADADRLAKQAAVLAAPKRN